MSGESAQILGLSTDVWNAFGSVSNVAITFGLLWFARRQLQVTRLQAQMQREADEARVRERQDDQSQRNKTEARALERDFQSIWAEHFRLEIVADGLAKADLVDLASLGALRRDNMLPADTGSVVSGLSRLGPEAGFLGGVAQAAAQELSQSIGRLQGLVDGFARQYPEKGPAEVAVLVRNNSGEANALEKKIRADCMDLALLLWDALNHSASARLHRELHFRTDMRSWLGPSAAKALVEQVDRFAES